MRRTSRLLTFGALCAALLAGCTPESSPAPSPSTSTEPVFASEEEALAAAEATYREYWDLSLAITAEAGQNPERLKRVVTDDLYSIELVGFDSYAQEGLRSLGEVQFTLAPQSVDLGSGALSVYVCVDYSNLDVIDSTGASVIPADRPNRSEAVVSMVWEERMKLASYTSWSGGVTCP